MTINEKDPYLVAFGENLRTVRKSKKISQGKLSIIALMPLSQIGRIERGEINTKLITLKRIAIALDIQPYELLEFPFKEEA